jgi:hypothetical protein
MHVHLSARQIVAGYSELTNVCVRIDAQETA